MLNTTCWWCLQETEICGRCRGMYGTMESCDKCRGSGQACPRGDDAWEGTFSGSDEETTDRIFAWIQRSKDGDPESLVRSSIPFSDKESLSYLAFATNFMGNREKPHSNDSLRRVRWFMHCRDIAIAAGGEKPRVMRMNTYADAVISGRIR